MKFSESDLLETLGRYPNLASFLTHKKVSKWMREDPFGIEHDLIWWLGFPEASGQILDGIEHAVSVLRSSQIPGIQSRLNQLRDNADWPWGTLVEIIFIAWLVKSDVKFFLPSAGPDVLVGDSVDQFPVEVTAIQRSRWFPRLFERMDQLAADLGTELRITYTPATPSLIDFKTMMSVVSQVRHSLLADSEGSLEFSNLQYSLTWSKSDNPQAVSNSTDLSPNSLFGAKLVMDSVRYKVEKNQLPQGIPGCLVVDVTNDEGHHVLAFQSRIGFQRESLDWTGIPAHFKHVFVYWTQLNRLGPWSWIHLVNPNSDIPNSPEFETFKRKVFPQECPVGIDQAELAAFHRGVQDLINEFDSLVVSPPVI